MPGIVVSGAGGYVGGGVIEAGHNELENYRFVVLQKGEPGEG